MITKTKKKDLAPMAEFVNEVYEGNLLSLTKWLDRAIYMFHDLTAELGFTEHQRQNVCYTLMEFKERLMEAYFRQNGWKFAHLD